MVEPVFVTFALFAGALSFFSPCSVALLPAYAGAYLGLEADGARGWRAEALAGARFGALAAVGILVSFVAAGAVAVVAGSRLLGPYLAPTSIAIGAGIVLLGALMLAGRAPSLRLPVAPPRDPGPLGFVAFGAAYGAASLGCTLPVFLSVLGPAIVSGDAATGVTLFALYAGAMASLMVVASVLLALFKEAVEAKLRAARPYVTPVSGAVLMGAGLYLIWYYASVYYL